MSRRRDWDQVRFSNKLESGASRTFNTFGPEQEGPDPDDAARKYRPARRLATWVRPPATPQGERMRAAVIDRVGVDAHLAWADLGFTDVQILALLQNGTTLHMALLLRESGESPVSIVRRHGGRLPESI